jgi:hypothetical protein
MQKVQYIQVSHWFISPNGKKDKSFCAQCGLVRHNIHLLLHDVSMFVVHHCGFVFSISI